MAALFGETKTPLANEEVPEEREDSADVTLRCTSAAIQLHSRLDDLDPRERSVDSTMLSGESGDRRE